MCTDLVFCVCNLVNLVKMSDMGPVEYFLCGGFGGICTVIVGHPLDTIKVSMYFLITYLYRFLTGVPFERSTWFDL